jgi:starch phosphorylase
LQFAISDGWTDEILLHEIGFAINPINSADSLYGQLEEVIVPMYYHDRTLGLPSKWLGKMKETILETTSKFSSQRMLAEYIQKLYIPALAKLKNN